MSFSNPPFSQCDYSKAYLRYYINNWGSGKDVYDCLSLKHCSPDSEQVDFLNKIKTCMETEGKNAERCKKLAHKFKKEYCFTVQVEGAHENLVENFRFFARHVSHF